MLCAACIAAAQTGPRIGLSIPDTNEAGYSQVLKKLGMVNSVAVAMRMPNDADDYTTEPSRLIARIKPHLLAGRNVDVRVSLSVNMSVSSWAKLGSGQAGGTVSYPVAGKNNQLWVRMGKHVEGQRRAVSDFCTANNIPADRVTFIFGNEPALGGAGGPTYLPYSKAKQALDDAYVLWFQYTASGLQSDYDKWHSAWLQVCPPWTILNTTDFPQGRPLYRGELPARYFAMRRVVRSQVQFNSAGFIVSGGSLETEGNPFTVGSAAYNELLTWAVGGLDNTSADVRLADLKSYNSSIQQIDVNAYSSNPYRSVYEDTNGDGRSEWNKRYLTPNEMAQVWKDSVQARVDAIRANYYLKNKEIGVMESNYSLTASTPSAFRWVRNSDGSWTKGNLLPGDTETSVREYNAFVYRVLQLEYAKELGVVVRVGWFTSLASDPTTVSNPLWRLSNGQLVPVGGEIFSLIQSGQFYLL